MQIEIVKATLEQEPLAKSLWELFLHDLVPVRCAPDADPTPGLHFTSG